jgi:integrase
MKPVAKYYTSRATGKRTRVWVGVFGDNPNKRRIPGLDKGCGIKEAQRRLDELRAPALVASEDPRQLTRKVADGLTVAQVFQGFIDSGAVGLTLKGRKRTTSAVRSGVSAVRARILRNPVVKDVTMRDLTPELIAEALRCVEHPRTRLQTRIWWRHGLGWAVRTGKARRNLALSDIVTEAAPNIPLKQSGYRRALRDEESVALMRHIHEDYRCAVALALYAGLRRGEIYALRKGWVDLERGLINVRGSNDQPKAKDGTDTGWVPIAKPLVPYLVRQLELFPESEFLCPHTGRRVDGAPMGVAGAQRDMHDGQIVQAIRRALKAGGVPAPAGGGQVDVHALRHTCATALVRSGAPMEFTRRVMRHKDIATTALLYTHLEADELREKMNAAHESQRERLKVPRLRNQWGAKAVRKRRREADECGENEVKATG